MSIVTLGSATGITVIPQGTPLARLNYFDGKFMRASDFALEAAYFRQLVFLSNQGLGGGVVYGFSTTLGGGDTLQIAPGLAVDPTGALLLLPQPVTIGIQDLIDASKQIPVPTSAAGPALVGTERFTDCVQIAAPPPVTVLPAGSLYVIVMCPAEALCGQEDVFGKLCEEACVTSTDRPFRIDGVVFRAIPLQLVTPFPTSTTVDISADIYWRSKVAHSYYADEVLKHPPKISRDGILSATWCLGASYDPSCCEVPLAVVGRSGTTTTFLDSWIARRERMEAPPKRYWQWRMMMRPWDVFMAQVLQFQCQLHEILTRLVETGPGADPCAPKTVAIGRTTDLLTRLETWHQSLTARLTQEQLNQLSIPIADISGLKSDLGKLMLPMPASHQFLIEAGVLYTPSVAWLPINVGGPTVNQQVRNLMGPGVDLRFCICRPDFVAHVLEEAQHMERISLLDGIDHPQSMPHVDVFVPNGQIAKRVDQASRYFDLTLSPPPMFKTLFGAQLKGAARWSPLGNGGQQLYWAGTGTSDTPTIEPPTGWIEATLDRDPFALTGPSQFANIYARFIDRRPTPDLPFSVRLSNLRFTPNGPATPGNPGELVIDGNLTGSSVFTQPPPAVNGPADYLNIPIRLGRQTTATGGRITVELTQISGISLTYDWTAGGLLTGSLHLVRPGDLTHGPPGGVDLVIVDVTEDPDALNPSNTFHGLSERAIPALQARLANPPFNDTGFATYAERALFPPPDPKSSLDVIATLDWVLFARRRESSCEQEVVTPPVKTTCHEVWRIVATPEVMRYLQTSNLVALENSGKLLGKAEFAVGTFSIASGGEAVLQKWKDEGDGVLDSVYVFAKQGDLTAEASLLVPRGQSIGWLVSPTAALVTNPREIASLNVPTTCPAITFLVAKPPVLDRVVAFGPSDYSDPSFFRNWLNSNHNLPQMDLRYDATQTIAFTDNVGASDDGAKLITELQRPAALTALGITADRLKFRLVALVTRRTDDPSGRDARVRWVLDKLAPANLVSTAPPAVTVSIVTDQAFTDPRLDANDQTNDLLVLLL
jgi:hypothetical protein